MPDQPPQLERLREDWQRALVVVPHPDDMEYGERPLSRTGPHRANRSPTA